MTAIPPLSPGCFGSALAYAEDTRVCQECPFREACKPVHEANRLILMEKLGGYRVNKVSRRKPAEPKIPVPAVPVAASQSPVVLALAGRVAQLVERLDKGQFDIVGKLQRGENPFDAKDNFLRIACHLLLRGVTLTRPLLQAAFTTKLGVKQNAAALHAAETLKVLLHVGAIAHHEGTYALRKN